MSPEQMERRILRLESKVKFLGEEFGRCVLALELTQQQTERLADLMIRRLGDELAKHDGMHA